MTTLCISVYSLPPSAHDWSRCPDSHCFSCNFELTLARACLERSGEERTRRRAHCPREWQCSGALQTRLLASDSEPCKGMQPLWASGPAKRRNEPILAPRFARRAPAPPRMCEQHDGLPPCPQCVPRVLQLPQTRRLGNLPPEQCKLPPIRLLRPRFLAVMQLAPPASRCCCRHRQAQVRLPLLRRRTLPAGPAGPGLLASDADDRLVPPSARPCRRQLSGGPLPPR